MILTQTTFYRRYGVRNIQTLMTPNLFDLNLLEFPMKSIYHYVTYDGVDLGPANDDYLFRNIKKPILIGHVNEVGSLKGNPRKQVINAASLAREYQGYNRRTRLLKNLETAEKDPTTLIIYNYCFINKLYKYPRNAFSEYFKWYNTFSAVVSKINEAVLVGDNHHYLVMGCPKVIPSLQQLALASKGVTQTILKSLRDTDSYFLLELWNWLSENRIDSLLGTIPNNKIHLVNIIYQETGKWCVINLGVLNSFRNTKDTDFVIPVKTKLDPIQLQKRIIRMMMTVMEARTVTTDLVENNEIETNARIEDKEQIVEEPIIDTSDDDNSALLETTKVGEEPAAVDSTELAISIDKLEQLLEDDENIDEELKLKLIKEQDAILDRDLALLNDIAKRQEEESNESSTGTLIDLLQEPETTLEYGVISICDRLADDGLLTAAEYKKFIKLANSYKEIISSDGVTTLDKFIKINPEDLKITESSSVPDTDTILDKSMLKSSLIDFTTRYTEKILSKDVANMVLNIQRAGIAVTGYKVDKISDVLGDYEIHILKLAPVEGAPSTIRFKLPKVESDGNYVSGGTKYRYRLQRGDLPIRKISPSRVALTSYYGKTFVNRGRKKSDNYGYWLQCQVMSKGLNKEDRDITELSSTNVFDNTLNASRSYTALSENFRSLKCRNYFITFDRVQAKKLFPESIIKKFEKSGSLVIGSFNSSYLVLDSTGMVYTTEGEELILFGTFEKFLNIPNNNAPVEYADLVIFGKEIPVGVVLSYQMGFERLLRLLKVEPRRVMAGSRVNLLENEYSLVFSDETLVFSRDDKLASIILAGFNQYAKTIKLFSVYSFDKQGVYLNLLDANKLSVRYLREINLFYQLFIDPITKDLLIEMNEPVTVQGLLFRSCELLLSDRHPDELDPAFMRIKGYERLSGAVYTELVQAIRYHNGRLGKKNQPIELNPYAVWKRISEDPSKAQVSEINPIKALKELEAVTYAGTGGRNKRSMVKTTRAYHPNDMGTISESTVDSSDVAINVFTCADPQFTSLRGISKRYDLKKKEATSLVSTSALLSVGADRDDQKRVNYIGIQMEHSIACKGYHQPSVRSGYEQVIAHRSSDLYAYTAKKPGLVKSIDSKGIIVHYNDGQIQGYEIGRRFGNAAGLVIPHSVVTKFKAGDKVEVGDAIVYNEGFFEPDFFNPKKVIWKNSANVKTVLWESDQTLEDASSISPRAASLMTTTITKVKTVVVNFDQSVSKLVSEGDEVVSDSILCIIEDTITSDNKLFDEQTIDTLRAVGAQTPRAHVKGRVEKVEVFYYGDKEDMSESLQSIVNTSNRKFKNLADSLGKKAFTGSVDNNFRIENNPLGLDTLAIKIYITTVVTAGVGDKLVFSHQMKSVASSVMEGIYTTENGEIIDAIFGFKSIYDRIVNSPIILGTTITLLNVVAKKAVDIYRKQAPTV